MAYRERTRRIPVAARHQASKPLSFRKDRQKNARFSSWSTGRYDQLVKPRVHKTYRKSVNLVLRLRKLNAQTYSLLSNSVLSLMARPEKNRNSSGLEIVRSLVRVG